MQTVIQIKKKLEDSRGNEAKSTTNIYGIDFAIKDCIVSSYFADVSFC